MLDKLNVPQISSTTNPFVVEEDISSNEVQTRTMNLPEPISINSVDSTIQERVNDGYEIISDSSIQNDSRDELDRFRQRITYSRNQLIDVYKSSIDSNCPDWITSNLNFPKRVKDLSENYLNNLVELDLTSFLDRQRERVWDKQRKPAVEGGVRKKELGNNEEEERNEQFDPGNNASNFRLNLNPRPSQEISGPIKEYNKTTYNSNYNVNVGFNNHSNTNFKNINPPNKFNERQPFNSNYRNNERIESQGPRNMDNRMGEDRTDGRGFLRSRGENLNQNFAPFRRFPNRNQSDNYNNYGSNYKRDMEPEWFTEGPNSQHDTIELKGFDEDENRSNANKDTNMNQQQQINQRLSPPHQPRSQSPQKLQQFKLNIAPSNPSQNNVKDEFDISEFANIDWQNVDKRNQNVDKVTIENQANSSRFARWFNEPHHHQQNAMNNHATEEQIEKLFSSARNINANQNVPAVNRTQFNPQQQQINLQNDFFGKLMNRNMELPQQAIKPLNQQLVSNFAQQQPQQHSLENNEPMNQQHKKTNQQLFNILQKARINVDSLMAHQNVLNNDNVIKGQAKSAEELEASLLNDGCSPPMKEANIHTFHQPAHQSHQVNPADLFQKLCLNSNNKYEVSNVQQQPNREQEDNRAINPFVLNLLDDAQKQRNAANMNSPMNHLMNQHMSQQQMNNQAINNNFIKNQMNSRSNYLPNMMYANNQQTDMKREVNPFMPTSVIRKIAKEKNSMAGNRGMSEANFEIVTGNHINERSIAESVRVREIEKFNNHQNGVLSNFQMNQAGLMQQNFAIATGNQWNENIIQQNADSTPLNHQNADQQEALRKILMQASRKQPQQVDANALLNNNFVKSKHEGQTIHQFAKNAQNDSQRKLIEILQKASTNFGKAPTTDSTGNKINDWFELEMQRNNNHLSPIIKENAFTLEDIENN